MLFATANVCSVKTLHHEGVVLILRLRLQMKKSLLYLFWIIIEIYLCEVGGFLPASPFEGSDLASEDRRP